jgi:hypothetical protein
MHKISSRSSKLVTWSLYKHSEGVYVVQVANNYERGMLFLRYQEHYESPRAEFRGQNFDIFHFMNQYRLDRQADIFSYPGEWLGFNIPGEVLLSCVAGVRQRNLYDKEMLAICKLIKKDVVGKFYVLGVDQLGGDLMDHELAHAFYYLDRRYRSEANKLISKLSKTKVAKMKRLLLSWGYREDVLLDEIQAYLATGLGAGQEKIFSMRDCKKFIQHFKTRKGIV